MMKNFLTANEAANYLGITEKELEEIVSSGKVSSYKIGGIYTRFKVEDLDAYRRSTGRFLDKKELGSFSDKVRDFLYFNDFYILSAMAIVLILYFIFK